jgi:hypothetical protein
MRCLSPRCPSQRAEGSRFCAYHRDLFASVAEEIEDGKAARLRTPQRRRRTMFRLCDWSGCPECAAPRESYCEYHLRLLARSLGGAQG